MSNLQNFIKNSDYAAIKSNRQIYSGSISISAGSVSDGRQWTYNITVPKGDFTIMSMITIDSQTTAPSGYKEIENNAFLAVAFKRTSATNIQLLVEVDVSGGGSANISAHTVSGSFILSPSPF